MVELVVVIAVIAVLAAVSVGAYFGVTKTAELSSATANIKQLNEMLLYDEILEGKTNNTYHEARLACEKQGMYISEMKIFGNLKYAYNVETKRFVIVENTKIVAPYEDDVLTEQEKNDLFVAVHNIDELNNNNFSSYLADDFEHDNVIQTSKGIDTGYIKVNSIELVDGDNIESTVTSLINTNYFSTTINISSKNMNVNHYGYSHMVNIHNTFTKIYNTYAHIGRLTLSSGSVDLNNGSIVFAFSGNENNVSGSGTIYNKNYNSLTCTGGHNLDHLHYLPDIRYMYMFCKQCGYTVSVKDDGIKVNPTPTFTGWVDSNPETIKINCNDGLHEYIENNSILNTKLQHIEDLNQDLQSYRTICNKCKFSYIFQEDMSHACLFKKVFWPLTETGDYMEETDIYYVCESENCPKGNHIINNETKDERREPRARVKQLLPTKEEYYLPGETSPTMEQFTLIDLNNFGSISDGYRLNELDVKFVFEALLTEEDFSLAESVGREIYKTKWLADFYVSFIGEASTVAANTVGLWGAYFGMDIAFGSPIDIPVNPTGDKESIENYFEIPLLGTMFGEGWEYKIICTDVISFRCGAFNLDPANAGITLNVELRLTNPEDPSDYQDICSYQHTFTTNTQHIYNENYPGQIFGKDNYPYPSTSM